MKKTFFYNFFPSKEEELACIANNTPHKVTRSLVEIHDNYPPVINHHFPWQIRQKLTMFEVNSGKLVISCKDTFQHILRYWPLNKANEVVQGDKASLFLVDVSDQMNHPRRYYGENFYLEMLPNDDYILACKNLFQDRFLGIDDEIGLFFDPWIECFIFKLLAKAM